LEEEVFGARSKGEGIEVGVGHGSEQLEGAQRGEVFCQRAIQ
jgi:hypothetical protein